MNRKSPSPFTSAHRSLDRNDTSFCSCSVIHHRKVYDFVNIENEMKIWDLENEYLDLLPGSVLDIIDNIEREWKTAFVTICKREPAFLKRYGYLAKSYDYVNSAHSRDREVVGNRIDILEREQIHILRLKYDYLYREVFSSQPISVLFLGKESLYRRSRLFRWLLEPPHTGGRPWILMRGIVECLAIGMRYLYQLKKGDSDKNFTQTITSLMKNPNDTVAWGLLDKALCWYQYYLEDTYFREIFNTLKRTNPIFWAAINVDLEEVIHNKRSETENKLVSEEHLQNTEISSCYYDTLLSCMEGRIPISLARATTQWDPMSDQIFLEKYRLFRARSQKFRETFYRVDPEKVLEDYRSQLIVQENIALALMERSGRADYCDDTYKKWYRDQDALLKKIYIDAQVSRYSSQLTPVEVWLNIRGVLQGYYSIDKAELLSPARYRTWLDNDGVLKFDTRKITNWNTNVEWMNYLVMLQQKEGQHLRQFTLPPPEVPQITDELASRRAPIELERKNSAVFHQWAEDQYEYRLSIDPLFKKIFNKVNIDSLLLKENSLFHRFSFMRWLFTDDENGRPRRIADLIVYLQEAYHFLRFTPVKLLRVKGSIDIEQAIRSIRHDHWQKLELLFVRYQEYETDHLFMMAFRDRIFHDPEFRKAYGHIDPVVVVEDCIRGLKSSYSEEIDSVSFYLNVRKVLRDNM